jgi:starch phosphorylase
LIDEHGVDWDDGLGASPPRSFSYTNHTLLPEALETWPVELLRAAAAAPPGDHLRDQRAAS